MMTVRARAPGKLFLTGEWAVLRGAPALVAAIDRHVEVAIEAGADGVVVESPRATATGWITADGPLPGVTRGCWRRCAAEASRHSCASSSTAPS